MPQRLELLKYRPLPHLLALEDSCLVRSVEQRSGSLISKKATSAPRHYSRRFLFSTETPSQPVLLIDRALLWVHSNTVQ